jgi:DNA-binding response OmpR family regulator
MTEKKQLGKILLKQKLISQADLDAALREQQRAPVDKGQPLASALTQSGVVSETDALRALSEQFGLPGIDLNQVAILLDHLDVVPREVAVAQRLLPVLVREDRIFLAMANPTDKRSVDELEFVTGRKVYPYIAITHTLEKTIQAAYEAKDRAEIYYLGPKVPPETLRQLGLDEDAAAASAQRSQQPRPKSAPPPKRPATTPPSIPPSPPAGPALVKEAAIERAATESELSDDDFGKLSTEVSTLAHLPEEWIPDTPQATKAGEGSKLILIVDDEEDIRKLLKRLLLDKGHRVLEADRGLVALRMVKEHKPDLIVLDAMLPELHGFDIARRIKGSEKYGRIPIIMISAVYRGWRIAEDLKSNYGIEEYIEKPFRISDVVAIVTKLLMRHEAPTVPPPANPDSVASDAEKALEEGIAAFREGDIDRAIEHLKRGTKIDPLAYRLRYHLALLYGKKGQIYDGVSELERAVELNPKHFPALKNLAVLYEKAGFKNKAIEMWERCVHIAPDAETKAQIKEHLVRLL